MPKQTWLSWSSGKDSAWALRELQLLGQFEVTGLFTTVNREFDRVAMHAVRVDLLRRQAEAIGLPLYLIEIPYPSSNQQYASAMEAFLSKARSHGVDRMAFGDLYLEDVRRYREDRLQNSGIEPVFPLWGLDTGELVADMILQGLRACLTCVDPRVLPPEFAGKELTADLVAALPPGVDPCGENGEFHTFVFDGPMFRHPLPISIGEVVQRDGFVFADCQLAGANV
jgi:uncharacterized protein (TIGR00290 family)